MLTSTYQGLKGIFTITFRGFMGNISEKQIEPWWEHTVGRFPAMKLPLVFIHFFFSDFPAIGGTPVAMETPVSTNKTNMAYQMVRPKEVTVWNKDSPVMSQRLILGRHRWALTQYVCSHETFTKKRRESLKQWMESAIQFSAEFSVVFHFQRFPSIEPLKISHSCQLINMFECNIRKLTVEDPHLWIFIPWEVQVWPTWQRNR